MKKVRFLFPVVLKKRNEAGADAAALECQGICETVHYL